MTPDRPGGAGDPASDPSAPVSSRGARFCYAP